MAKIPRQGVITFGDDTPWTCGDSQTAIEMNEPLGHTEILFPINVDGDPVVYCIWEPLAGDARQAELRARANAIAELLREIAGK